MDLTELTNALTALSSDDINRVATSLAGDTVGDEIDAWHVTIAIDRALRHSHRARQAARAAWDAAQAVQRAAERDGFVLPDPTVTHVARAAAEIARGIVAGDDVALEVNRLMGHWFPVLAASLVEAAPPAWG
jgi:hypothetical protein